MNFLKYTKNIGFNFKEQCTKDDGSYCINNAEFFEDVDDNCNCIIELSDFVYKSEYKDKYGINI